MAEIVFNGCTPEEIEFGKQFWKSIDDLPEQRSALSATSVPNISQKIGQLSIGKDSTSKILSKLSGAQENKNLQVFLDEAERRKEKEDGEKFARYEEMKNETQNRLNDRRQERIQKEEISKNALNDEYRTLGEDWEDDPSTGNEAREAMDEIDKFERRLDMR